MSMAGRGRMVEGWEHMGSPGAGMADSGSRPRVLLQGSRSLDHPYASAGLPLNMEPHGVLEPRQRCEMPERGNDDVLDLVAPQSVDHAGEGRICTCCGFGEYLAEREALLVGVCRQLVPDSCNTVVLRRSVRDARIAIHDWPHVRLLLGTGLGRHSLECLPAWAIKKSGATGTNPQQDGRQPAAKLP